MNGLFSSSNSHSSPSNNRLSLVTPIGPFNRQNNSFPQGLLEQRTLCYDRIDGPRLGENEARVVESAVEIAHRLVFCERSLRVLNFTLEQYRGVDILPPTYCYGWARQHITNALEALAVDDRMSVVVDRHTASDGYVRTEEPRTLRISSALVNGAVASAGLGLMYNIHRFHLASVIAHLICRSIRMTMAGMMPGSGGEWAWEIAFLGGRIKRIPLPAAPNGEILALVLALQVNGVEAFVLLDNGVLADLVNGHSFWVGHTPLWAGRRASSGRHQGQLRFQATLGEENNRM